MAGPFSDFFDNFIADPLAPLDPGGTFHEGGARGLDDIGTFIEDPLDLRGERAQAAQDEKDRLAREGTNSAIAAQRRQFDQVKDLFTPFVDAGREPLDQLVAGITGEGFDFQPSERFTAGVDRGTRATKRSAAARGLLDSSGTEARIADLVNALTGQEIQGQIESRLNPIRTSQDAAQRIGTQAGISAGQGSSAFTNLANQNITNAANFGQARQSSFDSAAGGLQGLAQLLATQ